MSLPPCAIFSTVKIYWALPPLFSAVSRYKVSSYLTIENTETKSPSFPTGCYIIPVCASEIRKTDTISFLKMQTVCTWHALQSFGVWKRARFFFYSGEFVRHSRSWVKSLSSHRNIVAIRTSVSVMWKAEHYVLPFPYFLSLKRKNVWFCVLLVLCEHDTRTSAWNLFSENGGDILLTRSIRIVKIDHECHRSIMVLHSWCTLRFVWGWWVCLTLHKKTHHITVSLHPGDKLQKPSQGETESEIMFEREKFMKPTIPVRVPILVHFICGAANFSWKTWLPSSGFTFWSPLGLGLSLVFEMLLTVIHAGTCSSNYKTALPFKFCWGLVPLFFGNPPFYVKFPSYPKMLISWDHDTEQTYKLGLYMNFQLAMSTTAFLFGGLCVSEGAFFLLMNTESFIAWEPKNEDNSSFIFCLFSHGNRQNNLMKVSFFESHTEEVVTMINFGYGPVAWRMKVVITAYLQICQIESFLWLR